MTEILDSNVKDLSKLFRTTEELKEPEESLIEGSLPKWLRGTFLRVGPGKFDFADFTLQHYLDGYAILSQFEIEEKTVKFNKRFVQSDSYIRAMRAGKPVVTEFGTKAYPEKKGILARLVSAIMPEMTDNDISNVFQLGDEVYIANDSCYFRNIDPYSLETGDKYDSNKLFGLNGLSAHPLTDEKGDTYNIGFSVFPGLKFSVIKIPPMSKTQCAKETFKDAKVLCQISSSYSGGVSYVHSFGMTDKFLIFIEQPYVASVQSILHALIKGYSVKEWLDWKPNLKNRFYVIEKKSGKVLKTSYFSDEAFFFLHIVNCYEEEIDGEQSQIIVDLIALDNPDMLDGMYLCKLRKNVVTKVAQPSCRRFVIPLSPPKDFTEGENCNTLENCKAKSIRNSENKFTLIPEVLTKPGCEMPVINKKFAGKDYSYFYVSGTIAQNSFSNAICKVDIKNKKITKWKGNEYLYPGEPVYVPNLNPSALEDEEDSGVLVASVSDVQKGHKDFIIFIDAKTMTEIARCAFREHIPSCLHGIFIQAKPN